MKTLIFCPRKQTGQTSTFDKHIIGAYTHIMVTHESNSMKGSFQDAAVTCIGMQVRRVARVVSAHYDACLKPTGLKGTQYTLLNAVYLNPFVSIGRLAEQLLMDRTTLNRNLKPLDRQGLVRTTHRWGIDIDTLQNGNSGDEANDDF